MNEDLNEALQVLNWGSTQQEQSASLTPAQCRAILNGTRLKLDDRVAASQHKQRRK